MPTTFIRSIIVGASRLHGSALIVPSAASVEIQINHPSRPFTFVTRPPIAHKN